MDILNEKGVKVQKIKGVAYVYRDKPYWDAIKKQNRHNRDYIGKIGEDGQFIPNKRYLNRQIIESGEKQAANSPIASRKFFGAAHLLDCINTDTGLKEDLKNIFGDTLSRKIMSLAYFLVLEGESSMYRFEKFAKTHQLPYNNVITSQRISEIFAGITENEKALFFKSRTKRCLKDEYLAYDTTSISSYSELMKQIKYGKNKDLEHLSQLNSAMVFGEESKLPVYYRKLPGNITDVTTIKKLLADMDFLGLKKVNFVLDRGFYSANNIDALYVNKHKFIVAAKKNVTLIKSFIDEMKEKAKDFSNYDTDHNVYCFNKKSIWVRTYTSKAGIKKTENKVIYIHGYYDGVKAEQDKKDFIQDLKTAEETYKTKRDSCSVTQKNLVDNYFVLNDNGGILNHNQEAINAKMANFGYFVLLSNHIKDAKHVLAIYRNKDVVEKTFCNLKNRLDMNRTKVGSEEALEGKLFVQFIALIYISYIHKTMLANELYKNYSTASLLDEVDVIEMYKYESNKHHYSEITKKQCDILLLFNAQLE